MFDQFYIIVYILYKSLKLVKILEYCSTVAQPFKSFNAINSVDIRILSGNRIVLQIIDTVLRMHKAQYLCV